MPKCRAAPTASGSAHLGTLCSTLINYIFARKDGSEFLLRIDRHPMQSRFEKEILEDLQAFGFKPDKVILQREREARYREIVDQILEEHSDKVYFCDCSIGDITFRGATGSRMELLHREEKYPSHCEISSIRAFGPETSDCDLVLRAEVQASISARGHGVEYLVDGRSETFWKPKDVGYLGDREPEITFRWQHLHWVSEIEIVYRGLPLRGLRVQSGGDELARIQKSSCYYYAQHQPESVCERISFAPAWVKSLTLDQFSYFFEVKKEYYYDGFCRNRGLRFPLSDPQTTIRIKNEEAWWLPDVAIVFDGNADLALTSAIDDRDYGIELRIRGTDIQPFTLLESEAGRLLGDLPPSLFHFMLCEGNLVKYSKFIHSPRAAELLRDFSADQILSLLAYKSGMLREFEILPLQELVQACDIRYLRDPRLPLNLPYKEIYSTLGKGN